MNTSFHPTPNYAALAEAAVGSEAGVENTTGESSGWMKGVRARTVGELKEALKRAVSRVVTDKKGMLVEVLM